MKIKAYTVVSPSHRKLLEKYLLPSWPHNANMDFTIQYIEQLCPTATFYKDGWHQTMDKKVDCFIEGIEKLKENEIFMFIDNDIVIYNDFYDDILNEISDCEIVFQNDVGGGCNTGFFAAKKTPNVLNLIKATKKYLNKFDSEQVAITEFCLNQAKYFELKDLKWKLLPLEKYWTYGVYRKTWNGSDEFIVPENIYMHHGNWCVYDQKELILDYVKNTQIKKTSTIVSHGTEF